MTKAQYSILDYAESKWEFLRRNDEYASAYKAYSKAKTDGNHVVLSQISRKICGKWHIGEPFDPINDFELLGDHLVETHKNNVRLTQNNLIDSELPVPPGNGIAIAFAKAELIKSLNIHIQYADSADYREWLVLENLLPPPESGQEAPISLASDWGPDRAETKRSKLGHITLDVDITVPEEILFEQFRLFVEKYKGIYDIGQQPDIEQGHHPETKKPKTQRPRFGDHKNFFKVYDLRKKGFRPVDIQKKLGISRDEERNRFRSAKRLVEEGFDPYRRKLMSE